MKNDMMMVLAEHQKQQQQQQQQHDDMTMMTMRQRRRRIRRRVVRTEIPLSLDHEAQQHRWGYPFLPPDLLPPLPTSNGTTRYYSKKFYPAATKVVYVSHGCLLIPVFLAAWWYYTKRAWYRTCRKFRPAINSPTNWYNCRRHHDHHHRCDHHSSSSAAEAGDGDGADSAADPATRGTSTTFFTAASSNFRGVSTTTRPITSNNNYYPPIFFSDEDEDDEEEVETADSVVSFSIILNGDHRSNMNSEYPNNDVVEMVQHEFTRMIDGEYDNKSAVMDGSETIAGRQNDNGRTRMRIRNSRQQLLFQHKPEDLEYNATSERPQSEQQQQQQEQQQHERMLVSGYKSKELSLVSSSSRRRRRCVKWINRQNVSHRQQKQPQPHHPNGHADGNIINVDGDNNDNDGDDGIWECIPDMNDVEFCRSPVSSDGGGGGGCTNSVI